MRGLFALSIMLIFWVPMSSHSETISLSGADLDEAAKSEIYQRYELVCNVCRASEQKKSLELALKRDMQYAKKYGVINYSRRDDAVQAIKENDSIIINGKKEYRKSYGNKFNNNNCKLVNYDDCNGALFELAAKILGRTPWEPDDVYPK